MATGRDVLWDTRNSGFCLDSLDILVGSSNTLEAHRMFRCPLVGPAGRETSGAQLSDLSCSPSSTTRLLLGTLLEPRTQDLGMTSGSFNDRELQCSLRSCNSLNDHV